ncbi:hypothetical protein M3936_14170 [Sutcliffiella horikoshii]|uniref:hypothetical protein n=1 Tax=Sutcliffiella horikoshii TaxID=79883 RepID=UPI002040032D|nr:hypothetical protein [Sutcliffiella horikoshii]MCM3618733.1 hypothetical protein [Sutcliffiella horikoshii]
MKQLCEICQKEEVTLLCDYAEGSGIFSSRNFQELTNTCDKKLCEKCATNLYPGCDVCPDHAAEVKAKLV